MDDCNIVLYTVKDIKEIFKCGLNQAYRIVNASGFPAIKLDGKIMVERNALQKWIEKNGGRKIALN